jgi:hypothetical protein
MRILSGYGTEDYGENDIFSKIFSTLSPMVVRAREQSGLVSEIQYNQLKFPGKKKRATL